MMIFFVKNKAPIFCRDISIEVICADIVAHI